MSLFWLRTAWRFLVRSWRSTIVLAFMIVAAVGALVFLSALAVGTNDAMIRNSVSLYAGHILSRGLSPDFQPSRLQVAGVEGVCLRSHLPVQLGSGTKALTLLLTGVDPDQETRLTALGRKTVAGRYPKPGTSELYISQDVAEQLDAVVGSSISVVADPGIPAKTFLVIGIYRTNLAGLDRELAFCPVGSLPKAPETRTAAVFLKPGVDPEGILAAYQRLAGVGEVQAWMSFMPDLKQLIDLNFVSMGIVMILVFGVVAIGITCAFIITLLKNLREYGILKAMGLSPAELATLVLGQVAFLTVAAALLGTLLGVGVSLVFGQLGIDLTALTSHNQYFSVSGVIYPRLTTYSVGLPPLLAALFGLLAAVWPMVFIIRTKSAEILRTIS